MATGIFTLQFYFHHLHRRCQWANLRQGNRFGLSFVNTSEREKATLNKNNHIHSDRGVLDNSKSRTKQKTGGMISFEVINDFL